MSSITHVVDSEVGEILNRYEYDAWGNPTTYEEKVPNRFKFNGQQYDSVTQQYYLRARYYNPVIGRFTQEDTYRGDGLNLYAYCANNPVFYVDPSGHCICPEEAERIKKLLNEGIGKEDFFKLKTYLEERQEAGTIETWEQDIVDQINLICKVVTHAEQDFRDKVLGKKSNKEAGPVFSTVYDPLLDEYSHGINFKTNKRGKAEYDYWLAHEADDIIKNREKQYQKDIDNGLVDLPYNHDKRLAGHSEVIALSNALAKRRASGKKVTEETISELYLYNIDLIHQRKTEELNPVDRCHNCKRMTDNINTIFHT